MSDANIKEQKNISQDSKTGSKEKHGDLSAKEEKEATELLK